MKDKVIAREVRWRTVDGGVPGTWTYERVALGSAWSLPGVVRGAVYEIEVSNLGAHGTRSTWTVVPAHTVAASNREGAAALPPVSVGNVSSRWVAGTAVNYSATATQATITVTAGTLQIGEKQVAYGASSAVITGTASEQRTVYLYYDDPRLGGGTRTLGVTTDPVTSLAAFGRIFIARLQVTFDVAGGGGSSGGGGIGGGGGGAGDSTMIQ